MPDRPAALSWLDRARGEAGPVYLAIVQSLEQAVRSGELHAGDRLPPQRQVAAHLGVDLTTVTRAYAAAQARGLVEGAVGRGTFVRARVADEEGGRVDLSMNLPPPPHGLSLGRLLQETGAAILERSDPALLMAYHPGFGTLGQRAAGARWLRPTLREAAPERLLVAPGAQAALAAIFTTLCKAGDAVVADPLTYPGLIALARQLGVRLVACAADDEGMDPDALAAVCEREQPKAIYLTPTLANPSTRTLGLARRSALARVADTARIWIVEDDPYSRLLEAPPPAIAALAPDRTFHVATLAKTLSPGLRIAYVVSPSAWTGPLAEALRATALMPAPLMAAVATRWIQEGQAEALLGAVREEARARRSIAAAALPDAVGGPESIHVWLPLAPGRSAERLQLDAQARGLALVTAEAFAIDPTAPSGARISLGGPARRAVLERALKSLAELVAGAAPTRTVV